MTLWPAAPQNAAAAFVAPPSLGDALLQSAEPGTADNNGDTLALTRHNMYFCNNSQRKSIDCSVHVIYGRVLPKYCTLVRYAK
jgi:hypothetical protein